MAFESLEPDPADWTMHLTASLLALFSNVYKPRNEPDFYAQDFLPGGNRRGRLSQGMAVMAQFAAFHAQRSKSDA